MKTNKLILLFVGAVLSGCVTYSYKPIEMHVVDADTNQPLEGVIVVARWSLEVGTVGGNVEIGNLQIMETTSDNSGQVYFPEWGPKTVIRGRLDARGAQLLFFKPGYKIEGGGNSDVLWQSKHPKISQWDGETFQLKKYKGSVEDYAKQVYMLGSDIDNALQLRNNDDHCLWKKIPKIIISLNNQSILFEKQNIYPYGSKVLRIGDIPSSTACGSPYEFFKEYQK